MSPLTTTGELATRIAARFPNGKSHEPMTTELLLDLLDAVAAKLNRRAS